jgi:hypothetical protein
MSREDRLFKVKFLSQNSTPIKTKLTKSDSVVDVKGDFSTGTPKDEVYYDEVIYYDGGGVEGYGY